MYFTEWNPRKFVNKLFKVLMDNSYKVYPNSNFLIKVKIKHFVFVFNYVVIVNFYFIL